MTTSRNGAVKPLLVPYPVIRGWAKIIIFCRFDISCTCVYLIDDGFNMVFFFLSVFPRFQADKEDSVSCSLSAKHTITITFDLRQRFNSVVNFPYNTIRFSQCNTGRSDNINIDSSGILFRYKTCFGNIDQNQQSADSYND